MSLSLPTQDSEIRELIDINRLANKEFTPFRDAIHSARDFFSDTENRKAVKDLFFQVIRADGRIQLLRIGPKGGRKIIWNFGKI